MSTYGYCDSREQVKQLSGKLGTMQERVQWLQMKEGRRGTCTNEHLGRECQQKRDASFACGLIEICSCRASFERNKRAYEKPLVSRVVCATRRIGVRLYIPCTYRVSSLKSGSSHVRSMRRAGKYRVSPEIGWHVSCLF